MKSGRQRVDTLDARLFIVHKLFIGAAPFPEAFPQTNSLQLPTLPNSEAIAGELHVPRPFLPPVTCRLQKHEDFEFVVIPKVVHAALWWTCFDHS